MNKIVLVVAAHSDDEALGCAGTMAKHIAAGDQVHVIFMTDGVGSRNGEKNEVNGRLSSAETVAEILGVASMLNLSFPDNKMDTVSLLDVTQAVEKNITEIQPNIIYTHHIGDLNIDHQITHKAVMTACRPQPDFFVKEIYAFEVLSSTEWQTPGFMPFVPNVFIDITNYIEIKREVLEAYAEEIRQPPHARSILNALRLNALRGNSIGFNYAEAFVAIRIIRQ
jgi:LmbE family N-acetylglucosaminyl deacetylase